MALRLNGKNENDEGCPLRAVFIETPVQRFISLMISTSKLAFRLLHTSYGYILPMERSNCDVAMLKSLSAP